MSCSQGMANMHDPAQVKLSDYNGKLCITVAGRALSGVAIAIIVVVVILAIILFFSLIACCCCCR